MRFSILSILLATLTLSACGTGEAVVRQAPERPLALPAERVPDWAADAVFYQIFPERFRNGDPSNDPTRESLEWHADVPASWEVSPWTGDWYATAPWEEERGGFYDAVFHRRYGGDLQGVLDKLDYMKELGVNTLYFNPVFWARSMHKYDGNSFHHVDPYFGPDPEGDFALMAAETADPATWQWTAADRLFLRLVEEAHARGLRVVIDGVFNHTGRDFFAFKDLHERQQDSPYADWYIVRRWDDPDTAENEFDYEGWWGVASLPVFADAEGGEDLHPGPKRYVFDATSRWMDPNGDGDPADGIDGWRLDVANEVPVGFWADWNAHVRALNPEAYTVTEIWEDAAGFLAEGGFSATMNYHGFAFPVKGFLIDGALSATEFGQILNERREGYAEPVQHALQNLIDSHDTPRLASMVVNRGRPYVRPDRFDYDWGERVSPRYDPTYDVRAPGEEDRAVQRLTALFQMTYVGAPMIYFGTEAGMWGADDPDDRKPMVWPDLTYAPEAADPLGRPRTPDPIAFDSTLYGFYQQVIDLRARYAPLRRGDFEVLVADPVERLFVFRRTLGEERVVVVLNRSEAVQHVNVPWMGSVSMVLSTAMAGLSLGLEDGALALDIPPLAGMVLVEGGAQQ